MNVFQLDPQVLQEIKRLHFQTRRLANEGVQGLYRSAFRGRGIEFEEVREYFPGDDVRAIDWKVTARSRKPYIKSYREERELTVLIAVDVSASSWTGTRVQLRDSLVARIGAALTFIALANNDKVGLVTFSDRVESYHPPRKARTAVWRILHQVLNPRAHGTRTDLNGLCTFVNKVLKRKAIVFLVSDFFDRGFGQPLAALSKRHDVTAVLIRDPADYELAPSTLIRLQNPESGEIRLVDTANEEQRKRYASLAREADRQLKSLFQRHGVGLLELHTEKEFLSALKRFLDARRVPGRRRGRR